MKQISKEELKIAIEQKQKIRTDNNECQSLVLIGYDIHSSDLSHYDMSDCDLRHSDLSFCDLRHCDLSYSDLSFCDLSFCDLSGGSLSGCNLSGCNLKSCDLSDCDLSGCDLSGCDMDFSSIELSCNDLGAHLDDRLIIQRLYHTLFNAQYSKNVSLDLKTALLTPELVEVANRFHRVAECGEIEKEEI